MKDKTVKKSGKGLRIVFVLIMAVLLGIIGFCVYNIIIIQNEYNESKDAFQAVADLVVKKIEVPASDDNKSEVTVDIDFDELAKQNKDIFAWIYCEGTPLNYPVVKGKNNEQYLRHLIDGRYNNSGTLFLDAANSKDLSDARSFIFGHNMKNGTMFACLLNYSKNGYYEEHPYIYLFTKDVNYRLEVFSAYKTTDADKESYSREFDRDDLRRLFGMVLQDTWLFQGTIMENIRYGRLDATDEEVIAAAKAAHADSFIRQLPDGYQMELNEDASNVSQGQKQLLTIARAILADNRVMILDEATSSVDTRTEILIQKAMDHLMEGRTSFIIAHRLSTIRNADMILVMKDGDIIEQGTHEELLERNGFYADLYRSQFAQTA